MENDVSPNDEHQQQCVAPELVDPAREQLQQQQCDGSDECDNAATKIIPATHMFNPQHFDINLVCDSFRRSIDDANAIDIVLYLQAFSELNKFFNVFGTLFSFVTKDVQSKIDLLRMYASDPTDGAHYATVQSMIAYETARELLRDSRRASGSRTLLRLHRALEFIFTFLREVTTISDDTAIIGPVRNAYTRTLSRYHPWIVRKSVQVATLALPYRRVLLDRVYGGVMPPGGTREIDDNMTHLAAVADRVFRLTDKLYEQHQLHDLP